MNNYIQGLLTIPAAWVALQVVYLSFKATLWVSGKVAVTFVRVAANKSSDQDRARLAAMTYATRRCWMFATHDIGIAFYQGQRPGKKAEALERLSPSVDLSRLMGDE